MSSNIFNPQRQYYFVLRQFWLFQNRWAIAAGAIFGILLIVSILIALYNPIALFGVREFYNAVFIFGGLILTSQIFMELHAPNRSYSFLSLPASTLEKLAGSWLFTSPLYIVVFYFITFIIYLVSFLIAGEAFSFSYFFTPSMGHTIANYMVIQTIFLWGACYFRKNNFLKTLLALIVFLIGIGIYTGLLGLLLMDGQGFTITIDDSHSLNEATNNIYAPMMKFLFWGALGPYMLIMSYFTLKERQV